MKLKPTSAAPLTGILFSLLLISASSALAQEKAIVESLRTAQFNVKEVAGHATEIGWGKGEWTPELWNKLPEMPEMSLVRGTAKFADTKALEVLTKLPKLHTIYFNATIFDDSGFGVLAKCKELESIALDHNFIINGSGAIALKGLPKLKSLRFGGCVKMTSEAAKACAHLTQLESLQFFHMGASDVDVATLLPLVGNLKHFVVASQFNAELSGAALEHLARFKNLESLKFGEVVVTYDDGLKHLAALKNLKKLDLDKVGASEEDINKLKAALPGCEIKWTPPSAQEAERYQKSLAKLRGNS
ncbi:hypothetical protein [Roseimicrobium sp. ORNL1]|uniref:hypothetical protein n=1 Tax=Roseimicrobium sp. ORNL1 TaxID=2711231 RepID=UPI0013E18799|nr:hypothetical protein [Roseimicrobium sp. ORNL1]QIF00877.1 hypothetical protein G5S37_04855 [Roseimicrobium sp. ORNL1]